MFCQQNKFSAGGVYQVSAVYQVLANAEAKAKGQSQCQSWGKGQVKAKGKAKATSLGQLKNHGWCGPYMHYPLYV